MPNRPRQLINPKAKKPARPGMNTPGMGNNSGQA